MNAFLDRPIEREWPALWIDAAYVTVRSEGRIVSKAVIVAVGVNGDGRRAVLGMDIGPFEAETSWTDVLHKPARRGLRGVKLVISDAHESKGVGCQGDERHLAVLPRAFYEECSRPCRPQRSARGLGLHRHRLRPE